MAKIESKGKSYKSVISIDSESLIAYRYDNNELNIDKADKFVKDNFYISSIASKDIINTQLNISKSIADDDIQDAIELKVYDDLGLDPAVEYNIIHIEDIENQEKDRVFDVYVIKLDKLHSNFTGVVKKIKYVDYIAIPFFLPKALYNRNLLESDSVDCFIYFQKNDAFLSIYENGEHLYSKSLRYSLLLIYEKFCESVGERVDEEDFFTLITNEGLKNSNITQQQHLMKLFGEIFLYINDVVAFARRQKKIEHIDRIYIGSEVGQIVGVDDYSKNYLGVQSQEFNFSIAINTKEWYVDQVQMMMILTALDYLEDPEEKLNLSIIKRPPPFLKRASGQIITALGASLILSFAYPAYNVGSAYMWDMDRLRLKTILDEIRPKAERLRTEHKELDTKIKDNNNIKKERNTQLVYREEILKEIHRKKVQYDLKAEILSELFDFLHRDRVKIDKITGENKIFILDLKAKEDRYITQLIKALVQLKKYKVHTKKIENSNPQKDEKKEDEIIDEYIYKSELKLELK